MGVHWTHYSFTVQQILDHMDESGIYNESDLAPFHRRLADLRCVYSLRFFLVCRIGVVSQGFSSAGSRSRQWRRGGRVPKVSVVEHTVCLMVSLSDGVTGIMFDSL
jgi:hypothetical protein